MVRRHHRCRWWGDCRRVRRGGEATFERGVPRRHLDPLLDDSIRGDAFVLLLEVLPVDLFGVGVQGLSDELREPVAGLDIVRAQPLDELRSSAR